jgi:voltage-gated potassium channel
LKAVTTPPVEGQRRVRDVRRKPIERQMSKFLREPPSVRLAARVIVVVTFVIVVGSGVLMRIVDHKEYSSVWIGMWWALQTVTTVGYGDVTPKDPSGRIVAALVMLEGIAFLAIVTAAITSTFVARAEQERAAGARRAPVVPGDELDVRFEDLTQRLDRIETMLSRREPS